MFDMNKSQLEPKLVTIELLPWDLSPRGHSIELERMLRWQVVQHVGQVLWSGCPSESQNSTND